MDFFFNYYYHVNEVYIGSKGVFENISNQSIFNGNVFSQMFLGESLIFSQRNITSKFSMLEVIFQNFKSFSQKFSNI